MCLCSGNEGHQFFSIFEFKLASKGLKSHNITNSVNIL